MVFSMEHCTDTPKEVLDNQKLWDHHKALGTKIHDLPKPLEEWRPSWTPHIQAYVYFNNAHSFGSIQKRLTRASIRPCKGSPEENFDYVSKDGEFYEFGVRPSQGKAKADKLQLVMEKPYENFHLWNQYNKGFKELKAAETFKKPRIRPQVLFVDYLWEVINSLPDEVYIWNMGGCDLFDGYQAEDTICLNMPLHSVSGPELLLLEQWIIYNRPPRYRCGYVWSVCTASKVIIACEDKYKNLQEIKSFLSIEEDANAIEDV